MDFQIMSSCEKTQNQEHWQYRFSNGFLVEEVGEVLRYYGTWNKLFGFWEGFVRNPDGITETIPCTRYLNDNGLWLKSDQQSSFGACKQLQKDDEEEYNANASFTAFFGEIPTWVRRVAGPFDVMQWLVMEMIWHDQSVAKVLERIVAKQQLQHFFALASLQQWTSLPRKQREELPKYLKSIDLYETLCCQLNESVCPSAVIRLRQFGNKCKTRESYVSFLTNPKLSMH